MTEPVADGDTLAQIGKLQEVQPIWQLEGHEVCRDVHFALSVAQAVLKSQRERVADLADPNSGAQLLRELQALGVHEASPQTVAMVALVESAVDRLAAVGAMSRQDAWQQLYRDVLDRHCDSA
ncbi:hypothetical protein QEZ54_30845 [Catellatospora sp. KI3]|uniref:hypothetical protein n=1 Tax=Catellatospora sp. KI3 TaxID=3041620 RepID=UPI0024827396|nr:hypothetical protein [Catellatospora sp. KI3]MDI1465375.1 hypothetical protein [Catellatospora sp. KI3]